MDLQKHYRDFRQRDAEIVALAVQGVSNARRMVQVSGAEFPILADADHRVAEAYQVYNLLGDGKATPAVFIVDREGRIVWTYVGKNANDRPGYQTILDHLPSR